MDVQDVQRALEEAEWLKEEGAKVGTEAASRPRRMTKLKDKLMNKETPASSST
jgi:hypothetical protein